MRFVDGKDGDRGGLAQHGICPCVCVRVGEWVGGLLFLIAAAAAAAAAAVENGEGITAWLADTSFSNSFAHRCSSGGYHTMGKTS
ncbi:hypothetical protein E2C01_071056 [Portunus trituberculatus]|uniref:Uncharacterized protein n=1 Tax=Portunus trituberculatus TaxID=210409 RepID=A0A5B7I489_PORTR|nr:hypothetical protein [Portunus trituberculatus]